MKTILIGFGDIAEKYIPVLTELNCDIIGVVGRDYKKTLEKSRKLGISNVFKSIENIPVHECDFLMNLTSADSISSTLKQIISLKKPIFTEKPIGFGVEEITNLINENKKFNSRIMVGTNRRFYSIFHKALKFLQEQDKKIESIRIDAPERFTDINNKKFNSLIEISQTEGLEEISEVKDHFDRFGNFLPNELEDQRIELEARLLKEI